MQIHVTEHQEGKTKNIVLMDCDEILLDLLKKLNIEPMKNGHIHIHLSDLNVYTK